MVDGTVDADRLLATYFVCAMAATLFPQIANYLQITLQNATNL